MQFDLIKGVIDKKGIYFISSETINAINNGDVIGGKTVPPWGLEFKQFLNENNYTLSQKSPVMWVIKKA